MAEERLQKILARAGIASRRHAEQLMLAGHVTVNGQRADRLGMHADPDVDHIRVDGKLIGLRAQAGRHYFLAFKPRNMITTLADPEGRPTVADLLKRNNVRVRVFPVGRLDWDADGLLILTDDGDLANRVMHPRTHLPKVYEVKIKGEPTERDLDRVRRGVMIERGVRTLPAEIVVLESGEDTTWMRVTLVEGRQNQIKRMFERIGHPVRRIRRIAIGPLRLGRLRTGFVKPMSEEDQRRLRRALDEAEAGETPSAAPRRRTAASREEPGPPRRVRVAGARGPARRKERPSRGRA